MKQRLQFQVPTLLFFCLLFIICSCHRNKTDQSSTAHIPPAAKKYLFVDVHNLTPGKVNFADVAAAHQKDLAIQQEFSVSFKKYWVDETKGKVYCLAEAADSASVYLTHKKAHGLVPDRVMMVTNGTEAPEIAGVEMYFDVHHFKPGSVTPEDVAKAHVKDLAVQNKYRVSFVNYWVDQEKGIVMCLANAPDSAAMVKTHKEAHGLIPEEVHNVKEGM